MNKAPQSDPTMTWVWGKVEPGWYVARWIWKADYAAELEAQGYQVIRSVEKPTEKVPA